MIRLAFTSVLFLIFINNIYAVNELQRLDFLPKYSVLNSSALANDSGALLINPAGLASVDRINLVFSTTNIISLNYFGISTLVPLIGGTVGFGVFNTFQTNYFPKRGFVLGWGREVFGCLSAGISLKTVSANLGDFSDGLLSDIGIIFYPNDTLGWGFLKNKFINNKLFFSFVAQNLGKHPAGVDNEELNLRLGIGYNLDALWTRLFVEQNLISAGNRTVFGFEINPDMDFFRMFSLRASTDMKETLVGLGINGEDAGVDFSYNINKNKYMASFIGYFEKTRQNESREIYDDGMTMLNSAQDQEKTDLESALDKYRQARQKFGLALFYDKNNKKAAYRKLQVDNILADYQDYYIKSGQNAEKSKDYVSAFVFYNDANKIEFSADTDQKIKNLQTNQNVLSYVKAKRAEIKTLLKSKKYLSAYKQSSRVLIMAPDDPEIKQWNDESRRALESVAEYYYNRAVKLYDNGNFEGAIYQAQLALKYNSDMDKAKDLINYSYSELGNKQGMNRAYDQFKNKNYMAALKMVNWILSKNPDRKDASDLKNRIMKIFRDNENMYLQNGQNLYNNGDYEHAIEEFDKVMLVDPGNPVANDYRSRSDTKMKAIEKLNGADEEE
jgi:tetratricopeptide (TPR) repeat protein